MIRLNSSPEAAEQHVRAVMNRIQKSFDSVTILLDVQKLGAGSIEEFLLADIDTMRDWVVDSPELLQFTAFKDMYNKFFSNGADKYVDGNYNAYCLIENLDVYVCPYCDDEYLDAVVVNGKKRRSSEIDHFFPKSKYPALAMCFYNLVPCGQTCNGLKMENELGANPHEEDIENLTFLYPDLPIGVMIDSIDPESCVIHFHAKKGMTENVSQLALEQRYEKHAPEAHRLLLNLQLYNPEKIAELVTMGCGSREHIISTMFAPQNPTEKRKTLHQKMVRDLTGY